MKTMLFQSITGGAVDREAGIIRGVSVVTEGEAKGHGLFIDATTLQTVKAAADEFKDGVAVKTDHGTGFSSIVGSLRSFTIDGPKLRSDLHLIKSHDEYETIVELSETQPSTFGLSMAFAYTREKIDGKDFVRVTDLFSVDLVDRPAANPGGLFSDAVDSKTILGMEIKEIVSGLFGKDGTVTTLQVTVAELKTALSAAQAEATNFKTKHSELTAELSKRDGQLAEAIKQRDEFKAIIDKPDGEIEKRAGLKAKEITAALGQPPLDVKPGTTGGTDILAQFAAIKKPAERTEFYRKNKAAYDAAWAAANPDK
jgi:hypothetical protein